jgi:tetratricopeptide (TPR) repeat protein
MPPIRAKTIWRWAVPFLLGLYGCKHSPTEKELQGAQIHYDLGIQQQQAGEVQMAYSEFQKALELDPKFAEAHNASGILLHLSFQRIDEAIGHYQRAIALRPNFSEAKTNMANAYLDQGKYEEAIRLYREVLNDMLYPTPYIAQGNLGWALYRSANGNKEQIQKAEDHIRSAVTLNPKFCLGYKNLGIVLDEQGRVADACKALSRYRDNCPEVADAYYREGVCLAKLGDVPGAKRSFASCEAKAPGEAMKDTCHRLLEHLQ